MVRKNGRPSKNNSVKYTIIYTFASGLSVPSIFRTLWRSLHHHLSAAQAIFTPFIHPNLSLPRTRPPSTTFWPYGTHPFAVCAQNISILTDPLLSNSLSTPALQRTSSYPTLYVREIPTNFSNTSSQEHSIFFFQHFSHPMPLL